MVFEVHAAVKVRRLHEYGTTGWAILLGIIPIVGALIILYFMIQDSQPGDNQYGPNPKEVSTPVVIL